DRLDPRANLPQRDLDPHRAPRERLVPDEIEPAPLLAREEAGGEAQHRPRVAAVERPLRLAKAAQTDPAHAHDVLGRLVDLGPERAHDVDRRVGVGRVPEAAQLALALRDRAEQDAALADPLDARDG